MSYQLNMQSEFGVTIIASLIDLLNDHNLHEAYINLQYTKSDIKHKTK